MNRRTLQEQGLVNDFDLHLAATLGRVGGEEREAVLATVALLSRSLRDGHVCLNVASAGAALGVGAGDDDSLAALQWPPGLLDALAASPLVGSGSGDTPLVLDRAGRLYLRRYWWFEQNVIAALRQRAQVPPKEVPIEFLKNTLPALFAGSDTKPPAIDWQQVATLVAFLRPLCIVSGGPGTGKTFIVANILSLLLAWASACGQRLPRIMLLAPTGKAAARLSESLQRARSRLPVGSELLQAIPTEASTIHRALVPLGGSRTRFRYHRDNPLGADVVVVDECSMVDLALMARLLDALPATARLVLLGDEYQLASVQAGSVLGDLCNRGEPARFSRQQWQWIEAVLGVPPPKPGELPARSGIHDCLVRLTRSYRFREDGGIGAVAAAVKRGDAELAWEVLMAGKDQAATDVASLGEAPLPWRLSAALGRAVQSGFQQYFRASDPEARLAAFERFRVLCANRYGPFGIHALNTAIERLLESCGLIECDSPWYLGRPILVTENDYQIRLFNGDWGSIVRTAGERGHQRMAAFRDGQGKLRLIAPGRLPPHETAFAMTIHKSQGSEFDEVEVVLPPSASPLLTRELVYTALTRARHRVRVHATREAFAHAVRSRIERSSGLRDGLWG
ncbi:MAG: exodeoxyribonuclease V subunit alpha [Candidatus Binatia bacterium]|nr:exodeoxyribonuclease V subunit alpha [Candidatus Binatia bacterium]